jgi:uncharacterized protein YukE
MDFKLDIGELTTTIRDYENTIKTLAEQKENINKTVKELTDLGWSGAAKDQFEQNHSKKQEFYTKLEEDFKYVENAMERDEKPEAVKLKKRCEGFEECIRRSAGGAALTHDDVGTISLQYSGQAQINNNVDKCTNDHYKKMDSKFVEIQNLVNSLTFTSFPIGEDIEKARKSLKDQTTSLTDFNDSFNEYCSGVKTMESNICSVFGKISGITEGISKLRGISVISEGGQVDKNIVKELMLKDKNKLTTEEKEILEYAKNVLGEDEYKRLEEIHSEHSGPTVKEAAYIADNVYFENYNEAIKEDLPGGWKLIDYHDGGKSLQVGVYGRLGPDGKEEYVIANRGSRSPFSHIEDWKTNGEQAFGQTYDVTDSLKYVDKFITKHPEAKITFVGHSKGGAEAALNAVYYDKDAILFNPAAANLKDYGLKASDYHANMTAYVVDGEILNGIEGFVSKPIDKEVTLPTQHCTIPEPIATAALFVPQLRTIDAGIGVVDAGENHSMASVKSAVEEAKKKGIISEDD